MYITVSSLSKATESAINPSNHHTPNYLQLSSLDLYRYAFLFHAAKLQLFFKYAILMEYFFTILPKSSSFTTPKSSIKQWYRAHYFTNATH